MIRQDRRAARSDRGSSVSFAAMSSSAASQVARASPADHRVQHAVVAVQVIGDLADLAADEAVGDRAAAIAIDLDDAPVVDGDTSARTGRGSRAGTRSGAAPWPDPTSLPSRGIVDLLLQRRCNRCIDAGGLQLRCHRARLVEQRGALIRRRGDAIDQDLERLKPRALRWRLRHPGDHPRRAIQVPACRR